MTKAPTWQILWFNTSSVPQGYSVEWGYGLPLGLVGFFFTFNLLMRLKHANLRASLVKEGFVQGARSDSCLIYLNGQYSIIYNVNKGKPALTRETYWPLLITSYSRLFGRDLFYSLYKDYQWERAHIVEQYKSAVACAVTGDQKGREKGTY